MSGEVEDMVVMKTEVNVKKPLCQQPRPESPDTNCAICLEPLNNKSFTDRCLHQFCFECLLEWSKIKQECPLCKKRFMTIIHNVRSEDDYDEYPVQGLTPAPLDQPAVLINFAFQRPRFRYRTTMGPMSRALVYIDNLGWTRQLRSEDNLARDTGRAVSHDWRRRRQVGTSEFRRHVYRENMWVRTSLDPRIRQSSPEFYSANPAQTHRLVPWLNRELNVLLDVSLDSHTICQEILQMITVHRISSQAFHRGLSRYLGTRTSHFVHEFFNFATSPYDMLAYDLHAQYTSVDTAEDDILGGRVVNPEAEQPAGPRPPTPFPSTDSDSDIEVVGWRPQLLDLDMAGPSGAEPSSPTILIEISDDENSNHSGSVEFIDEFPAPAAPTPEVITLVSEEENIGEGTSERLDNANVPVDRVEENGDEDSEGSGPRGRKRRKAAADAAIALVRYDFTSTEDSEEVARSSRHHRRKHKRTRSTRSLHRKSSRVKYEPLSTTTSSSSSEDEASSSGCCSRRKRRRFKSRRKSSYPSPSSPSKRRSNRGSSAGTVVKEEPLDREDDEDEEVDVVGVGDEEEEEQRKAEQKEGGRLRSVVRVVGAPPWQERPPGYAASSSQEDDPMLIRPAPPY